MEDIILVGYGGHAKSVIDSIEKNKNYNIVGYTDFEEDPHSLYTYLGRDEVLREYYEKGVRNAFVTVGFMGNSCLRQKLYQQLKEIGYQLPVIIDPSSILAGDVRIGEGTFVGKRCIVNASATIGNMCILNSGSIIEHECDVGDYSHIAVGAVLCGSVTIKPNSLIGAGATVIQTVEVGENSVVGAGAVVTRKLLPNSKVVGVPAKNIK